MHFSTFVLSITSASLLTMAAPLPFRRASTAKGETQPNVRLPPASSFNIPGVNASEIVANMSSFVPFATAMADVDSSCSQNSSDIYGALTQAIWIADMAKTVKKKDLAFNLFFRHKDLHVVRHMFGAISNKTTSKLLKVSCPKDGQISFPVNSTVFADTSANASVVPVYINPTLFAANSSSTTSSTTTMSTGNGAGSQLLGGFLQELTRVPTFAQAAKIPNFKSSNSTSPGTSDIATLPDEQNPGSLYSNLSTNPLELSVCLKMRWDAQEQDDSAPKPPLGPEQNAPSYASFGALYMGERLASMSPDKNATEWTQFGMAMLGAMASQSCQKKTA